MAPVETLRWNGSAWDLMNFGPHPATVTPPNSGPTLDYTDMLIGAAVNSGSQANFDSLEAAIGPLAVFRSYDSGFTSTWQNGAAKWVPDRVVSWHSLKPSIPNTASGALDSQLRAWVQSIPLTHRTILTFQHEMENPSKGNDPAQFRTAFQRFYSIVKEHRPDILVGPVYMSWTFDNASGRNWLDWWPGDNSCDFMGIDTYETYMQPAFGYGTTWKPGPEAAYVKGCQLGADHGKPPAIGECKAAWGPPDSTNIQLKVDWAQDTINYTQSMDGVAVCWFNSGDPRGTAPGGFITDDTATTAYFANLIAHPLQVKDFWV